MRTPLTALALSLSLFACSDDTSPEPADSQDGSSGGDPVGTTTGDVDASSSGDETSGESTSGDESSGGDAQPDYAGLEAQLDALRMEHDAPGLAVGLVRGDQVLWTGAFGTRDLDTMDAVTVDTPFRLGSISKTFVGVALMRAQELGVIDLDDAIDVPFAVDNPHLDGESITYRHLAMHTSGIVDTLYYECAYVAEGGGAYSAPDEQAFCPEQVYPSLAGYLEAYLVPEGELYVATNYARPPEGEPGTTYEYSNVGAGLAAFSLGLATEDALGQDFIAFSNEEVFGALGLEHTRWMRDQLPEPDAAAMPHMYDDGYHPIPRYDLATFSDGALYSSVADLSHYLAAIVPGQGGDALQPASAAELIDFAEVNDDVDGQGIFWENYLGFIGHTGGDPGVSTAMGYDPDDGFGFVILLNSTGPGTEALTFQVLEALRTFAADLPDA